MVFVSSDPLTNPFSASVAYLTVLHVIVDSLSDTCRAPATPHARRQETHTSPKLLPPKLLHLRNGHGYAREHELPFTSPWNERERQF